MIPFAIRKLPIYSRYDDIIAALHNNQVIIVAGETGSGKSTSLPLFCREAGWGVAGQIAITQPRRIAAITLAGYVASQDGTPPGVTIGFKVRYRQQLQKGARIVYMTDGILLASLGHDPLLSRYEVIIIDEAHERSLTIDFLLGYLRLLLPRRPDLRVIIASATLDSRLFSRAFNHAPVISVPGRLFTVEIRYKPVIELWKGYSIDSFIEGALVAVEEICASRETGDVLVFLPTVDDVSEMIIRLRSRLNGAAVTLLPLHSRLSIQHQQNVFRKYDGRKIVVATPIAETSLTVPDIRYVVDTGLVRMLRYEPSASLTRMPVERVSQASADQRAGRCGRVRDGTCIRLYSEQDYCSRPRFTLPEIKRANLAGAILRMHALELDDPSRFPFVQQPAFAAIAEGYRQLQELGALDKRRRITAFGRAMALFPLDPPVACMLLRAKEFGAVPEVTVITAALAVQEPLTAVEGKASATVRAFRHPDSDFMTYLNVWKQLHAGARRPQRASHALLRKFGDRYGLQPLRLREWIDAYEHMRRICNDSAGFAQQPAADATYEAIHKSLCAGLIGGIAARKDAGVYTGIAVDEIRVASVSVVARKDTPWLLFHEIVETEKVYGTRAAVIDPAWVEELFGNRCRYRHEDPRYDPVSGTVRIREEVTYRSLTLVRNRLVACDRIDRQLASRVFIQEALTGEGIGDRYRFIRCNREVRAGVAAAERKLRKKCYRGDEALEEFYEERAPVATRRELDQLLRQKGNDASLIIPIDRLLLEPLPSDIDDHTDEILVAAHRLPVTWEHAPGSPSDGATVVVPQDLVDALPQYYWEWQLPVFSRMRVEVLVARVTSQLIDRGIDPADVVDRIVDAMRVPTGPWMETAGRLIGPESYNATEAAMIDAKLFPLHLWLRVNVVDGKGLIIDSFRPPLTYRRVPARFGVPLTTVLQGVADGLVRNAPFTWDDVPPLLRMVPCGSTGQRVACALYPALFKGKNGVSVRVFATKSAALTAHAGAIKDLLEVRLAENLTWEIEALRIPAVIERRAARIGIVMGVRDSMVHLLVRMVVRLPDDLPVTGTAFGAVAAQVKESIPQRAASILPLLNRTLDALEICFRSINKKKMHYKGSMYQSMHEELEGALHRYRNALYSGDYPVGYVLRLPEYLDAFPHRATAAFLDPVKYRSIMKEVYESQRSADAVKDECDYCVGRKRDILLETIEQYLIDQFTGAIKRGSAAITAEQVDLQRETLQTAIHQACRS